MPKRSGLISKRGISLATGATSVGACVKIASKTAVSGASIASTNLTWVSNINLGTHMPLFAVIKFASGVLGINVTRVLADTVPITAAASLLTVLTGTTALVPVIASLAVVTDNTKFLKADVTTASLAASTFDITVYGVPY